MSVTEALPTPKVRGLRTPNSALRALKKVIKGREDYVYEHALGECVYVDYDGDTPKPSCLVGQLLHNAGVPLEWLATRDSETCNSADSVARALGLPYEVGFLLREVQSRQDEGDPWGKAVAEAAQSLDS